MKYQIELSEIKKEGETNGRAWKITNMTLKDEQGVVYDDVSTFDPVMTGQEIEGFIETKEQYKNFKKALEKPNFMKKPDISKQVEKAQLRTETSINKTLDRKEESIALAGAQRDAVLIVTELMRHDEFILEKGNIKSALLEWRNWFLSDEFKDVP